MNELICIYFSFPVKRRVSTSWSWLSYKSNLQNRSTFKIVSPLHSSTNHWGASNNCQLEGMCNALWVSNQTFPTISKCVFELPAQTNFNINKEIWLAVRHISWIIQPSESKGINRKSNVTLTINRSENPFTNSNVSNILTIYFPTFFLPPLFQWFATHSSYYLFYSCENLINELEKDYEERSKYISYLVRSKQGLLSIVSHLEQITSKLERYVTFLWLQEVHPHPAHPTPSARISYEKQEIVNT